MYGEGYTIRGVQRILREQGAKFVAVVWQEGAPQPPHGATDEDFAEEAASATEMLEEESGLRGRLSSLIGRDLADRQDDVGARHEPPLKSAPVPRIEPTDRAIHGAPEPEPAIAPPQPAPPVVDAAPPYPSGRLARDDLRKLHAVLHELAECRKLIETAVTRAE